MRLYHEILRFAQNDKREIKMTLFCFRGIIVVMDDKNKTQAQTQSQQPQQSQVQPPQQGVGSLVKEHGPVATGDLWPSGIEPEIHRDLEQIGVKSVSPEFPEVKPDEQRIGIKPAKESMPVQTAPSGLAQIPMTEEEARLTLKHTKPSESRFGLATVIIKFFRTIHHNLLTNKN